jgi:malonate transporter
VASGFSRYVLGSSLLTVLIRLKQSRDLADASLDGLNAAYPNAGFIALSLCMLAFGHASLAPTVIGMIMTVCVLFAVAIVLIELGLQTEKKLVATMGKVVRSLVTNPLLFAPFAGWLCSGTGLTLSGGADTILKLLGAAASPCALVALGLFLGEKSDGGAVKTTAMLVLAKLVA